MPNVFAVLACDETSTTKTELKKILLWTLLLYTLKPRSLKSDMRQRQKDISRAPQSGGQLV